MARRSEGCSNRRQPMGAPVHCGDRAECLHGHSGASEAGREAGSLEEFYGQFSVPDGRAAAEQVLTAWLGAGYRRRIESNHVVLEAAGPATSGVRTVIAIFNDGRIFVPFSSYAGVNSGIEIPALITPEFRASADSLFGFTGTEKQARTQPGWLSTDRVEPLLAFCLVIANAYKDALAHSTSQFG